MPDFLYMIKGKDADQNWCFPPLFSDKVEAVNRKAAIEQIHELFDQKFPTRVLKKDIESNNFILIVKEIKDNDNHTKSLFQVRNCENCNAPYKVIEKYQTTGSGGGMSYCSTECRDKKKEIDEFKRVHASNVYVGSAYKAVIYRIWNSETNKSYIGKTSQIFTLRWYQHFYQKTDSKFHKEIDQYPLTSWKFEIIEIIKIPDEIATYKEIEDYIFKREMFWVDHYDAIKNGYNSVSSKNFEDDTNKEKESGEEEI